MPRSAIPVVDGLLFRPPMKCTLTFPGQDSTQPIAVKWSVKMILFYSKVIFLFLQFISTK